MNIPTSVKTIGSHAFYYCKGLKNVTIGESVMSIGNHAFSYCDSLTNVTCKATTVPNAEENAFFGQYDKVTLFVPNEALEGYQAHEEWGKFTHIVPFIGAGPGDVNGDGNITIGDVTNLIDQLINGEEIPAYFDVNGNGSVTIGDITAIIDMLLAGNH